MYGELTQSQIEKVLYAGSIGRIGFQTNLICLYQVSFTNHYLLLCRAHASFTDDLASARFVRAAFSEE
jgi:hypothetical protein